MADLARDGLRNLQARSLRAIMAAPTWAAQLAVQRDVVEGARRLEGALRAERTHLEQQWVDTVFRDAVVSANFHRVCVALETATEYREAAEAALARYEARRSLETGR